MNLNRTNYVPLQSTLSSSGSRGMIGGKRKPGHPSFRDNKAVKKLKVPGEKPLKIPPPISRPSALTSEDREIQIAQLERHQLKKLMEKNMRQYKKALAGNPLSMARKRPSTRPAEFSFKSKKQISHKKQLSLKDPKEFLNKECTKSKKDVNSHTTHSTNDDFDLLAEKLLACSLSSKQTLEEAKFRSSSKTETRKESTSRIARNPKPLTLLTEFSRNVLEQPKSGAKTLQNSFVKSYKYPEMPRSGSKTSFSLLGSFKPKSIKESFDRENKENVYRFNY